MKWVLEDLKLATVNSGASFRCFFPPLTETKPTVLRPPMMREVTTDIPMFTSARIFSYSTCISFYQLSRSLHTVDSVAYAWTVHKFLLLLHCILISPPAGLPKSPLATIYKLRPSTFLFRYLFTRFLRSVWSQSTDKATALHNEPPSPRWYIA